jgi:hypothetical protein
VNHRLAGPPSFEVFVGGLVHPRGLAFGPDGALYVAEAGDGGPELVDVGREAPHAIGYSGRISRIAPNGQRTTLVDRLPTIVTAVGEEVGPSGLAFLGNDLYLLTAAGGWEIGDPAFHNTVARISPNGALEPVLDLSAYIRDHPTRAVLQDPRADVPMGMPFGLAAADGRLYLTEANQEQVLAVSLSGEVTSLLTYPFSNRALTGITSGPDGAIYVAEFAASQITRLGADGKATVFGEKLQRPLTLAFDRDGWLYAGQFYLGRIWREPPGGKGGWEPVIEHLTWPTALAFGPDGLLYVSNGGSRNARDGEIVRVRPPPTWIGPLRWLDDRLSEERLTAWLSAPWAPALALVLLGLGLLLSRRRRGRRHPRRPGSGDRGNGPAAPAPESGAGRTTSGSSP